ncbi:MAG TPA: endonuclease III, partial [Novosphingobium sp.]|nr:endonuclease III [Novosphingobium sp.]
KARRPECWRCPVADLCAYKPKEAEPAKGKAKASAKAKT